MARIKLLRIIGLTRLFKILDFKQTQKNLNISDNVDMKKLNRIIGPNCLIIVQMIGLHFVIHHEKNIVDTFLCELNVHKRLKIQYSTVQFYLHWPNHTNRPFQVSKHE